MGAFEGWNVAGSAASRALEHLHEAWGAEQADELDPEEYHDYQVNRPVDGAGDDGRREITWPTTAV
ncbi:PAC2 family protein, partial [Cellulomonas sp. GbtcB1]|uniref:PAC2 family protein n=1 Tax=Cellulomonas sp. GbtcB1 TaxID=2824746 RepID=UPI001C2F843F